MDVVITVGFDGTCLRQPRTGVGTYTYNLIKHISDQEITVKILDGARSRTLADYEDEYSDAASAMSAGKSTIVRLARKSQSLRRFNQRLRDIRHSIAVRDLDIYHATNFLPLRPVDKPMLPLIHDVSHLRHPQWHPKERVEFLTGRSREFLEAPLINTVSQFSALEITRTLGIQAERIRITSPGTNPRYFGEPTNPEKTLRELDLEPGRYFLCVGTLEPRKNLSTLVSAYVALNDRQTASAPLIIVGPAGWGDLNFPRQSEALIRNGKVRFPGFLREPVMHTLYAHAAAFLYPSLYEGFGMPVAEAMATGTRPVVASGGAPQEVAGDLGRCVPASEADAWRAAMEIALDEQWHLDSAMRSRLTSRAGEFCWDRNAEQTMAIYHELSAVA